MGNNNVVNTSAEYMDNNDKYNSISLFIRGALMSLCKAN